MRQRRAATGAPGGAPAQPLERLLELRTDSGSPATDIESLTTKLLASLHLSLAGLCAVAAIPALAPAAAHAQSGEEADAAPPDPPPTRASSGGGKLPIEIDLAAGTRFPLELGIDAAVEVPLGFTFHLGIGWMPRFYRDMINDTAVSFGFYDETDAALVAAALEDALLITPMIGWRPPPLGGLELYGGYVMTFLGGSVSQAEAEALSGEDLSSVPISEVPLSGKAHAFQIGIAYQAFVQRHVALRLSLAYFQIFDSSTSIDVTVPGAAAMRIVDRVETALDGYLGDLLTTYVKAPLFGFAVVWRF